VRSGEKQAGFSLDHFLPTAEGAEKYVAASKNSYHGCILTL
jgi:hypothetical protein